MAATSQKRSGTTDLTVGKPLFQILRFALPLVLGTLFQQLYSFADTVIVGRCLGTDALGAVGTTYSLNFLILGFVQGACVGFGIPAAETFGAKDKHGLQKYLLNGALLCLVLSVVFTVLTTLMAGPLLQLIHTPEELYADAVLYIQIIFLGIPATVLYNYASSVLRALGDSRHPFYFLLVASVVNILLDYLFIVPLGMGVDGAAIATVLSQLLSGGLCAYWFFARTAKQEALSFRQPRTLLSAGHCKRLAYLQAHYQDPTLTTAQLAQELYASREHLSRAFKECTMESIHNYLTYLRMQHCRKGLEEGVSVLNACTESGFPDYSSFLKTFRRLYGITPAEYRAQHRTAVR